MSGWRDSFLGRWLWPPTTLDPVLPREVRPLKLIGYWPMTLEAIFLPLPQELVGASSESTRKAVCRYLRKGRTLSAFLGTSWCRFRCGIDNSKMGNRELTDGEWVWPQGLVHYVESHGVLLPDEFVASAVAKATLQALPRSPMGERVPSTLDFWVEWGRTRRLAPLRRRLEEALYEAHLAEAILTDLALDEILRLEAIGTEPCAFSEDCPRPALVDRDLCAFHQVLYKKIRGAKELYWLPSDL